MPKSLNGVEVLLPDFSSPTKPFKNAFCEDDIIDFPELAIPVCEIKDFLYHSDELNDSDFLESLRYLIEKFVESLVLQERLPLADLEDYSFFSEGSRQKIENINQTGRFRLKLKVPQSTVAFPVLAAVIYDTETNRFYIRFGCSPDINEALSRTLFEFLGHWKAPEEKALLGMENLFVPIIPYEIVNKIENQIELNKPRVGFFPEYIHQSIQTTSIQGFMDKPPSESEALSFLLSFLKESGYRCYIGGPSKTLPGHHVFVPEFFSQFKTSNADIWRVRETYHVFWEEILPALEGLSLENTSESQYRNLKSKASEDLAYLVYLSQLLMRNQVHFEGIPTPTLAMFYIILFMELGLHLHEEALDTANIILMAAEDIAPVIEKTISNLCLYLSFLKHESSESKAMEQMKAFLTEDELDTVQSIIAFPGMLLA